ncbi:hypothetical protein AAOE16_02220 [Ekhidna sp. MALMAid0563]|uniref:hypothetical protein n=1 Tax=Ekhidna sp. MALMAid0563 TaxID=3143937 RepID=UPI0032DEAE69
MLHLVWRKKVLLVRMTEEQIEVKNKKWETIDWNEVRFVKFSWCQLYRIETNMRIWYFAPNDIRFQIFPGIPISDDAFAKLMRKKGFDT